MFWLIYNAPRVLHDSASFIVTLYYFEVYIHVLVHVYMITIGTGVPMTPFYTMTVVFPFN